MNSRSSLLPASIAIVVATAALLGGLLPALHGQNTYGTIVGRVTDAQDAVIPAAMVTATNQSTNIARAVQSGSTGDYSIINLLPGTYDLTVEMDGFKTALVDGISLRVNESRSCRRSPADRRSG